MTDFKHTNNSNERYHYTDSGLDNIWLIGGVEHLDTPHGPASAIHDLDDLHHAIALDIISSESMSAQEFRFLRVELELSQRALARLLKATEQQVHRWENKKANIPGPAQVALASYYLEATDPDSRMKDLLDLYAEIDALEERSQSRTFEIANEHWAPTAA